MTARSAPFLEHVRIERFGRFHDKVIGPFGEHLTIVFGPNEAGKTTVASFVGGVLWKRGNAVGAAAASLVGVVVVVLGMVGISLPGSGFIPGAILPIIPSAIAYIIVSLCTKPAAPKAA